jgi:Fur family ferric uptake transcriptional regulator
MSRLSERSIVQQLSQAGYRITQPRLAVIRALLEDDGHLSPPEVRERACAYHPGVGRRIHAEDGCHGYVAASHGHRHHLVCRRCGATVEFEGCELSPFLDRVSRETGYAIEEHLLELVGVCATCQL